MAQFVLTTIGGSMFGPAGGFIGSLLGGAVDRALFGPGDTRQDAPPLESLTVSVGADGHPIPDGYGLHHRVGRLIWSDDKKENRTSDTVSGGKDFGGPEHTVTTINPTVTCAYSFGWGPGRPLFIKANKRMLVDFRDTSTGVYAEGVVANIYDGTQALPSYLADTIFPAAPAYVGQIIVEFENLPIGDSGGDPPQVLEGMVLMNGTSSPTSTNYQVDAASTNAIKYQYHDPDTGYLWMIWDDMSFAPREYIIGVLDVRTRTWVYQERRTAASDGDFPGGFRKIPKIQSSGIVEWIMVLNTDDRIYIFDPDTVTLKKIHTRISGGSIITAANNQGLLGYENTTATGHFLSLWSQYNETDYCQNLPYPGPTGYGVIINGICELEDTFIFFLVKTADNTLATSIWYPEKTPNGGSFGSINDQTQYDSGVAWTIDGEGVYAPSTNTFFVPGSVSFVSGTDIVLFELDTNGTLVNTINLDDLGVTSNAWSGISGEPTIQYNGELDAIIWKDQSNFATYSLVSRTLNLQSTGGVFGAWVFYDNRTDTVFSGENDFGPGSGVIATKLNSINAAKIPVADALVNMCNRIGILSSQVDATGITDTMHGCSILVGYPARSTVEALLAKANGYGVMSDNKMVFREFGGATDRTFDAGQLSTRQQNQNRKDRLEEGLPQGLDIPAVLEVEYISNTAEGETTGARSRYHYENRQRPIKRTTPVVLDAAEASTLANRWHQSQVQRRTYKGLSLAPDNLDLEAGDIITVTETGKDDKRMMVSSTTFTPSLGFVVDGISEDPENSSAAGDSAFDSPVSSIPGAAIPQLLVLDTPLLRDIDSKDHPGMYVAIRAASAVANVSIYGSASGDQFSALTVVPSNVAMGVASTAADNVSTIDAWDDTTTLTIDMVSGAALSSLSDADVLAGGNACLYGAPGRWELIQPATWTLVSGSTWNLTHILRGRRGTDTVKNTHEIGDYLVILDQSTLRRLELSASLINLIYHLKAVASGTSVAEAATRSILVTGAPMKPYTVIDLAMVRASGTHTWTWTARTRTGGIYGGTNGLIDGVPGAQADNLDFEIEIWNLQNTVRYNTRTVTSAEEFIYTQSMRTDDGLTGSQEYLAKVYHMNGSVRGFEVIGNSLGASYQEIATNLSPAFGYMLEETTGTTADNIEGTATYDGTYTGTYTLDQPTIITGETRSVDWVNGIVQIPNDAMGAIYQVPGLTIALVVEIDSLAGSATQELVGFAGGSVFPTILRILNDTDEVEARSSTHPSFFLEQRVITAPITTGIHHIAMVVDPPADRIALYIDGSQVAEMQPANWTWTTDYQPVNTTPPSGGRLHRMFSSHTLSAPLVGNAQGAMVYAKVLTAEEIAAMASYVIT